MCPEGCIVNCLSQPIGGATFKVAPLLLWAVYIVEHTNLKLDCGLTCEWDNPGVNRMWQMETFCGRCLYCVLLFKFHSGLF